MTTTEAFEHILSQNPSPKEWGVDKDYFTTLRYQHKQKLVTLNRMEKILIKAGWVKKVQESWGSAE